MMSDISVILSTWNNCERLKITLAAISLCRVPSGVGWELVLVNNNCTDGTDETALEFEKKIPLVYVKEPKQGLSRAKNKGLKEAKGSLIIFTDDDVSPSANWLQVYWRAYQQRPKGFFFGGPVESEFESKRPDEELLQGASAAIKGFDLGKKEFLIEKGVFFLSANWACSREAILELGGFDEHKGLGASPGKRGSGEEEELMFRLQENGFQGRYLPEAHIRHYVPEKKTTLRYIAFDKEVSAEQGTYKFRCRFMRLKLFGVPLVVYLRIAYHGLRYLGAQVIRRKGYYQYIRHRVYVGVYKGFRTLEKEKSHMAKNHRER